MPVKTLNRPTILLLGTGRSGTTWLASLLARPFRYRLLFEPFMAHQVPGADSIADIYYQPDDIPDHVASFCFKALNDEINSKWIAQGSNRKFRMHRWRFWPKVRICKDIRSNLFIPAYRAIFGFDLPIIVLMRHPGAVVESFLRVKFPWAFDVSRLLQQGAFQEMYGIPLKKLQAVAGSDVEKLMVRWVVENGYLLANADHLKIHIVYYEDLRVNPVNQIKRICRKVGIDVVDNLAELVSKPSYTTHPQSAIYNFSKPHWSEMLPAGAINSIWRVLDIAEVEYPRKDE